MNLLPFEKIIYKTQLEEEYVIQRLRENTELEQNFPFGTFTTCSSKPYEGCIKNSTFRIKRNISYRNSFLPMINGTIEKNNDKVTITVKMKLHTLIIIFLCIWCGLSGFASIAIITDMINHSEFGLHFLYPLGMLLFAYALTMSAFKYESNKTKIDLKNIFEADIIQE